MVVVSVRAEDDCGDVAYARVDDPLWLWCRYGAVCGGRYTWQVMIVERVENMGFDDHFDCSHSRRQSQIRRPARNSQQPALNGKQPSASRQHSAVRSSNQQSAAASSQQQTRSSQQEADNRQPSGGSSHHSTASIRQPGRSNQQLPYSRKL